MSFPPPADPQPPATIGAAPQSASQVNADVGQLMRDYLVLRSRVTQAQEWLAVTDLKAAPYFFLDTQEATTKSGVGDLDTGFDAIPLAFISQLAGM